MYQALEVTLEFINDYPVTASLEGRESCGPAGRQQGCPSAPGAIMSGQDRVPGGAQVAVTHWIDKHHRNGTAQYPVNVHPDCLSVTVCGQRDAARYFAALVSRAQDMVVMLDKIANRHTPRRIAAYSRESGDYVIESELIDEARALVKAVQS
jgi:hypothetical protein